MSEQAEKRTCRMCAMEIPAGAKMCPYCRSLTHWTSTLSMNVTAFVGPLVFMAILVVLAFGIHRLSDRGQNFSIYRDQVQITESRMVFGEEEGQRGTVGIVGRMRNDSDVTWKDVQFEVEFYDASGTMMDTGQEEKYYYIAAARQTHPFKVSFKRQFPKESYSSFKIRVVYAKDADAGWR